jgi:hypothetical protein
VSLIITEKKARDKMKITQAQGNGQGQCSLCKKRGKRNVQRMCFLYKIKGKEGVYCKNCADEFVFVEWFTSRVAKDEVQND